jgi:hypothetical protein
MKMKLPIAQWWELKSDLASRRALCLVAGVSNIVAESAWIDITPTNQMKLTNQYYSS